MPEFLTPEEAQEHMDHMKEHMLKSAHGIRDLFSDLPERHLKSLSFLLMQISSLEDARAGAAASYYHGLVVAALENRFSMCSACGEIHTEALDQMVRPRRPTDDISGPDVDLSMKDMEAALGETFPDLNLNDAGELSPRQLADMEKYWLDDLRDQDSHVLLGFICTNCKMRYSSIADRTDLGDEQIDCPGCVQKVKHG